MPIVVTRCVAGVGVVTLDKPPVNALGAELRHALWEAITAMDRAEDVRAIVLHGRGRGFSAGGDIHEFGTPAAQAWPGLSSDLHPRIEVCRKPVVAAIHGLCLGGGLETAMACHWRVVSADASVGLPEVRVGVLPLSGTQRLPRLIGLKAAAQHIALGEIVMAGTLPALADLMLPAADEQSVVEAAVAFARSHASTATELSLVRNRPVLGLDDLGSVRAMAREAATPILRCALEAVLAAADANDFDAGLEQARALYDHIIMSAESVVLQRSFGPDLKSSVQ